MEFLDFFRRRRLYRDLSAEILEHVAEKTDALIASGMPPDEAALAARREFGNAPFLQESARDQWGWSAIDGFLQDVRYAARTASRDPAFTMAAVLILALGIGANTAIFSVVDGVLLRPLPYRDPARIVRLETSNAVLGVHAGPTSFPDYVDWRRSGIFDEVAVYIAGNSILQVGSASERVDSASASPTLFTLLGVTPLLGRLPGLEEGRPGARPLAMLGENLWRRDFGADPSVLGRDLRVDGKPLTVIGVLPASFTFEDNVGLWTTFELSGNLMTRNNRSLHVIAHLRPGQTLSEANSRLAALCSRLAAQYPDADRNWSADATSMLDADVGPVRRQLMMLLAAVSVVLLICCGNVAMLLLVRGAGRLREVGLRAALGASRVRIVSQVLMESVLISILGGIPGVLLARGLISLLVANAPRQIPRLAAVHIDQRVLLFALALSLLTTIFFGLGPALQLSRPDPRGFLRESNRTSTASRERRLLGGFLLIAETALSLLLLVGATLLVKSFLKLTSVDPGFRTDHLLTFHLPLPSSKFEAGREYLADRVNQYFTDVVDELERLPEVESAGAVMGLPLGGGGWQPWQGFAIPGNPQTAIHKTICVVMPVTSHYFRTMGIPLRAGRAFDDGDSSRAAPVAIVNEELARKYFGAQSPLGQAVLLEGAKKPVEVVGVVGSVKPDTLDAAAYPEIYLPEAQHPVPFMAIVVHTRVDPLALAPAIEKKILRLDPDVPPSRIRTAGQLLSRSLAQRRFSVMLMSAFAAIAIVLALIGLYGVISYSVAQSTREIGIRMALGARAKDVLALVLRKSLVLALAGIGVGMALSAGLTRLLTGLLFEVKPLDPAVLVLAPVGLAVVSLLACLVPARRAGRIDPCGALRSE
jgi:putative ABC transport system permease protein